MITTRVLCVVVLAFAACGATCGEGTSPVWHPQAHPSLFCQAMAHSNEVVVTEVKRGATLTFLANPGQEDMLMQALRALAPRLMTMRSTPLPSRKFERRLDKWQSEQLNAHGGSHGGGGSSSSSSSAAGSGAATGTTGGVAGLGGTSWARRPVLVDVRPHPQGGQLLIVAADRGDVDGLRRQLALHVSGLKAGACDRATKAASSGPEGSSPARQD